MAIRASVTSDRLSPVALIAEKTGLTRQYVYSMMAGTCNPSMDKIEDVFNALDLSFSDWINDRSLYGRDKKLHDDLQYILNKKGLNAVTIRNVIEGLLIRSTSKS